MPPIPGKAPGALAPTLEVIRMYPTPTLSLPTPTDEDMSELAHFESSRRVRLLVQREIVRRTVAAVTAAGFIITLDNGQDAAAARNADEIPISVLDWFTGFDRGTMYLYRHPDDALPGSVTIEMQAFGWNVSLQHAPELAPALAPVISYATAMAAWF